MSVPTRRDGGLPETAMMGLGLYKVTGDSMEPNYCSGDYVFTFRRHESAIQAGDVVVVHHPRFGNIIKRIEHVIEKDVLRFVIAGDNQLISTDSDTLGLISPKQVLGKVLWRIAAPK